MRFSYVAVLASVAAVSQAAVIHVVKVGHRAAMDVYAPPVTSPTAGDIWTIGSNQTVTWDASSPPKQITNPIGRIRLIKGNLITDTVLADGFNITDGAVNITVPEVASGSNYAIVLFGDSGNWSPEFSIAEANYTIQV